MQKIIAILLSIIVLVSLASCSGSPVKNEVTQIVFSSNTVEIQIKDSIQLSVTVLPSSSEAVTISWSSSNPAIAAVDDTGRITGISAGQTNIIAEAENGVYAICSVTVKEQTAYDRLTDRERKFVDAFLGVIDNFYNPSSVIVKYVYDYDKPSRRWDITVSAENQMGGHTEKDFTLYENGDFEEPFLPHVRMPGADKWYDLSLVNATIQEHIG